jgi:hypothetical protein
VTTTDRDRWLTDYLARHLAAAGVTDPDALAGTMSADIVAAFATLHRVEAALAGAGVDLDS